MKYSSRKYVDMIFKASSKWANWDPPCPVKCGQYGTINPETGQLDVEGNIYHESFKKYLPSGLDLTLSEHQPMLGEVEDDFVITSVGVTSKNLNMTPELGIAGIVNVSFHAQFQFPQGRRAATLIMHKPRQTFIPPDTILEPLFKVEQLKDKYLVTKTFSCPAYSLYLSNKSELRDDSLRLLFTIKISGEKLSIALVVKSPVAAATPGLTAGGEGSLDWQTNSQTEYHRKASDKSGKYSFTPLFDLRRKLPLWRRVFRESPVPPPEGDGFWTDAQLPWDPLDEDGEDNPRFEEEETDFGFEPFGSEEDPDEAESAIT